MSDLVAVPSLREFFKQMLVEAIHHQKLELAEVTEFYLVNLLAEFAESENLFTQDEGGRKDHEPLALLYYRALQEDRERKIRTLRRLGDVSLYKAGFFSSALRETTVGADYYIQIGVSPYTPLPPLPPPR